MFKTKSHVTLICVVSGCTFFICLDIKLSVNFFQHLMIQEQIDLINNHFKLITGEHLDQYFDGKIELYHGHPLIRLLWLEKTKIESEIMQNEREFSHLEGVRPENASVTCFCIL